MKIPLKPEYLEFYAEIDDEDYALVCTREWKYYPKGANGIALCRRKGMHQLILPHTEGFVTRHKDGDGLNNRRSNLIQVDKDNNSYPEDWTLVDEMRTNRTQRRHQYYRRRSKNVEEEESADGDYSVLPPCMNWHS